MKIEKTPNISLIDAEKEATIFIITSFSITYFER